MRTTHIAAALLASTAISTAAWAQSETAPPSATPAPVAAGAPSDQTDPAGADIVVTGIRASQAKSIDIKRDTAAIVDAISAEDIGKLPDVTIVDSLQRIPGVQILRNAGEGSTVNIRGLPQVVTLLNGEQYLSPANLGAFEPNLNDIPAQLFNGVVVYKSPDVRNALSGISGTLDLRTRRPFDFKDGFTLAGQAEYQRGRDTKENDYMLSGLASWRRGNVGIMASAGYSDLTLGNNYAGTAPAAGGGLSLNNDWGGDAQNWISPHGYETFHREVERKRFGASGAIQWESGDGATITAEGFYTKFIEHDLRAGMNISNRWTGLTWTSPLTSNQTGTIGPNGQPVLNVQDYNLDAWWVNSFSVNRTIHSESKNFSLEGKWDNGSSPFTASARGIYADADFSNTNGQVQGDLSNWRPTSADGSTDHTFTLFRNAADPTRATFYPANIAGQYTGRYTNAVVGSRGGRYVDPNPLGYARDPQLSLNLQGNSLNWGGFDRPIGGGLGANATLRQYMSNLDSYTVAAYSSEGNNRNGADILAFRVDGAYDFDRADNRLFGIVKRVDAGARASRRRTQIEVYHLFSRLYAGNGASDPNGCAVQWKAIDVVLDNTAGCTAGEQVANPAFNPALPVSAVNPQTVFQGYTAYQPTRLSTNNRTIFVDDFGSITQGFPGAWVADPRDFNDPQAFQERVFGNAFPVIIPGSSYDVDFYEQSAYANADLEIGPVEANLGLKAIRSKVRVRQNQTGATIPYGDTNLDIGDLYAGNSYWDFLPTINAQWRITDKLKVRAAFAKTMIPLALGNYGGGVTIATNDAPCGPQRVASDAPCGQRQVTSVNASGNPDLDPWRSNNYDAAIEYYLGRASLLNVGYFRLDIDSFVVNTTRTLPPTYPDSDGVVRNRNIPLTGPTQGNGGKIQGVEVGAKLALSDLMEGGSFLRNFGTDANYTFAPSSQNGRQRDGAKLPFIDNSKHQINVALWYQDSALQARVAWNHRSERLTSNSTANIWVYQEPTDYIDANVTYSFNDMFQVYVNGSNLTGEIEKYYFRLDGDNKQRAWFNQFEPRYSAGVRVKF